jgi:hypothetical protein
MRILSWDVGIHHLSYCILEQNEDSKHIQIIDWDVIDLVDDISQKKNITLLFQNIPKKLDTIPSLLDNIQRVCIENQPTLKNPTMKTIQIILYSYFLIRGVTDKKENPVQLISFISATNKLKVYQGPYIDPDLYTKSGNLKKTPKSKIGKNQPLIVDFMECEEEEKIEEKEEEEIKEEDGKKKIAICYGDKKKLAILYTREMIKVAHPEFVTFFESHKKKDDLADSFLQGIYVLTQKEIQERQKELKDLEKKAKPKKPRVSKKKNIVEQLQEEKPKTKRQTKKKKEVEIQPSNFLDDSSNDES